MQSTDQLRILTPALLQSPEPYGEERCLQLTVFEIEGLHLLLNQQSAYTQGRKSIFIKNN